MNDKLKSTIRQIMLDTVMFDTYGRNEDGDFIPINWEESPLLNKAVDQIAESVLNQSIIDQALSSLTKDGQPVGTMQCNGCGYIEAYQPKDVTAEDFKKGGKSVVEKGKKHFAEQGWKTSWGYDLCPECVKKKENERP